jgi:hypothetical protein
VAVRERVRPAVRPVRPTERWGAVVPGAALLSLAIFLFYFAPYPIRNVGMPAGFDPPWYIWRATFAGSAALGPVSTASRPGHALLSALLGSVTGRSQLELFVLFSQLLPAVLALAVGALATSAVRGTWRLWLVTVAVTGAVLGATRLVGENVANLLTVALEVGAFVVLACASSRRAAAWGSVGLLVAAGLVHWIFLAVFGVALAVTVGLTLAAGRRSGPSRWRESRGDAWSLATIGLWTAAILTVLIVVVLRAPFRTFDLFQTSREFAPKFITDVARLWPAAVAGALGMFAIRVLRRQRLDPEEEARRSLSERFLLGWTVASVAGVLFGLVTVGLDHLSLPPHRFLALLVAVPGTVAASTAVWWAADRVGWKVAGMAVMVGAVALLAIPSVIRWYKYPILMRPEAVQQAETAAGYVARLPRGQPFVFDIDGRGPAVVYDAPLRERMIRMALPPDRQVDLHLFVGMPSDLQVRRRTPDSGLRVQITQSYWEDVIQILPRHPPVLVLRAMGQKEFDQAVAMGAPVIGPGVALLQGPRPAHPLVEGSLPHGAPALAEALLWALAVLALLAAAGVGWTALVLGSLRHPIIFVSLAPLVGTGALLLGAFAATEAGVRLHGPGGVATYAVVTVAGGGWALLATRRRAPTTVSSPAEA